MTLSGGCRCGSCRYTMDYSITPVTYACHCLNCQTMSGASFALQAIVPSLRFHLDGAVDRWEHPNPRGMTTTQIFCATCKTRIYSTNEGRPDITLVRAGTLDESTAIVPAVHMWVKRKQPWISLPPNAETYEEGIPTDRLMTLLAPNFA